MGTIWDVQFLLSDKAALALLELGAHTIWASGPPGPREVRALLGAATALGLKRRLRWPFALIRDERPARPRLDTLTALEREVVAGAMAWLEMARGAGAPVNRARIEFIVAGAGVPRRRLEWLCATAERVWRHGRGLRQSVEFELLLLELTQAPHLAPEHDADRTVVERPAWAARDYAIAQAV
jgi:hypothetical protein